MEYEEAKEVLVDLSEYYSKKMPAAAKEAWLWKLKKRNKTAARRALEDQFDQSKSFPTRGEFMSLVWSREKELQPDQEHAELVISDWERKLAEDVLPHFIKFLKRRQSAKDWANNFRAIARQHGVENRIDWAAWEKIEGVEFYV